MSMAGITNPCFGGFVVGCFDTVWPNGNPVCPFFGEKNLKTTKPGQNSLSQWLNFKLFGITYLVRKIKFKLFFSGSIG